jgi:PKD repeat protein
VTWVEPGGPAAAAIVVARTAGACPTDRDVAAGTATTIYRAPPSPGAHVVVDSSFPRTGENDCYRAFALNKWGRASLSSDAISYTFGGPIAGFAVAAAPAGAATTFADTSTAQHSSIVRWTWNFGDPSSGAANTLDTTNPAVGEHPSHVYARSGSHDVTLTVTDSSGRTSTLLQQVEVPA